MHDGAVARLAPSALDIAKGVGKGTQETWPQWLPRCMPLRYGP